jgi:hypothetical protein
MIAYSTERLTSAPTVKIQQIFAVMPEMSQPKSLNIKFLKSKINLSNLSKYSIMPSYLFLRRTGIAKELTEKQRKHPKTAAMQRREFDLDLLSRVDII